MCVIISGTKKKPSLIELRAAEDQNSDGGGMAWITRKGVEYRKGLSADQIHAELEALPHSTRWVVHFRFATVGDPSDGLCHPFEISRDTNLNTSGRVNRTLFHNGTVSDWRDRLHDITIDPKFKTSIPSGEWSDSRGVAWLLALNESIRPLNFIEGKYIVLDRHGLKRFPSNGAGWSDEGGIMYSNTYWRRRIPTVIVSMDEAERATALAEESNYHRSGSGYGRSLFDEVSDLLEESDRMDVAHTTYTAPKYKTAKAKKAKKKAAKRKPRTNLKKVKQGGSSRGGSK